MIDKKTIETNKWVVYPDRMAGGKFLGYVTKDDISQTPGAFPVGQNIMFTDGMTPTIRPGSVIVGTEKAGDTPIKRAWRFEKRDGTQIDMRAYSDKVDFRIEGIMDEYLTLKAGFVPNLEFCFAVIAKSTEVPSSVFFCNGQDDWQKWSGAYARYASDNGSNTITVSELLAKPARLEGGISIQEFDSLKLVNNGSFRITIDGTARNIDGLNLTTATTMADIAAIIQTAIRTITSKLETCVFDTDKNAFIITTVDSNTSAITVATTSTGTVGTDISGVGSPYLRLVESLNATVFDREVYDFTTTGTIVINSDVIAYTGISDRTFTGCSIVPTAPTVGDIMVQQCVNALLTDFRGSVGIAHDGRIHARLETKQSVSNYSKLDDPSTWTSGANDGDGGAKEIEQGGPITAYAKDEEKLYIFKKNLIKTLVFKQSGDRVDVPVWGSPKPADDRSSTVGAIGQKSTFQSPNGVIFVTEDKEMIHLTRESNVDYPQSINISDDISPTFKAGIHSEATGICHKSKVYYAFKQDESSSYNDVVIVYDLIKKAWHTPYVGWNVGDWTIINNKLRWHSSVNPNTYELQDDILDNGSALTSILRTHAENFGEPFKQKTVDAVALELYLSDNFEGMLTILYDDFGFTRSLEVMLSAQDDISHVLQSASYNAFGASPFGTERFGSNDNLAGMKRYVYIIPLKSDIELFSISMQVSTDAENVNYELIRYAYLLKNIIQVDNKKFVKSII